jgi:predicted phosphoribosyltransferase
MFNNRTDAGRKLGNALKAYHIKDPLILGIPRGGVEVGYRVAQELSAPFSILIVKKLPFPDNPEAGFGAIAENGSVYFFPGYEERLPSTVIENTIARQKAEVERRVEVLRNGAPLPDLQHRYVILVDDGIAMGSTTQAAVQCCREMGAKHILVAAPVSSPDARRKLNTAADEVVTLLTPPFFRAVAEYYQHWYDVPDEEVLQIMNRVQSTSPHGSPAP